VDTHPQLRGQPVLRFPYATSAYHAIRRA
jgi:hypothetical protein